MISQAQRCFSFIRLWMFITPESRFQCWAPEIAHEDDIIVFAGSTGQRRVRCVLPCRRRGSRVSSTEMLMCEIPAAISTRSKNRGAHCLVPRNKTSVKDVQKITLWDLRSLIFTSRHSDTLQEDAWLLRRNYSWELRRLENSCKLLFHCF